MANTRFKKGREGTLDDTIEMSTGVIKALLVRGYTLDQSHKFVSDVVAAGGEVVATSPALTSKTFTDGVFDADDTSFTAVPAGAAITSVLIIQASAPAGGADVAATAQRLIEYADGGTNLPVTPNGGDLNLTWDNGASKIFAT